MSDPDPDTRRSSILASLEAQLGRKPEAQEQRDSKVEPPGEEEVAAFKANRNRSDRKRGARNDDAAPESINPPPRQELVSPAIVRRRGDRTSGRHTSAPVLPLPQVPERRRLEGLPSLPERQRKRSYATIISFVLLVVLPLAAASVYYIFYASHQYVAEFRFAVRDAAMPGSVSSAAAAGVAAMTGTAASSSPADNYMVTEYLTSRQIVDELQAKIGVTALYGRPAIDWWSRFDPSKPMEKFVKYWQSMVHANYDLITGIAVAEVRAFTPDDAYLIATTMVSMAENLVNQVAMRPRLDAVRYSELEVKRVENHLKEMRAQMTEYRDKEAVIDPTLNVVASNTLLAQTLRTTLMQFQTQLASLTKQKLRPDAPAIVALQSQIYAARQQLAEVEAQVANTREGNRPLSRVVVQYEKLNLDVQTAQTILTSAIQSLEQARVNAMVQPFYITPFVRPARPESYTYPNRIVSILTVGLACFFLWTVGLLVVRSIGEHLA